MGIDVPDFFGGLGMAKDATEVVKVVGDYASIAFYYFLQVGEYMVKVQKKETKLTIQFNLEDEMSFS